MLGRRGDPRVAWALGSAARNRRNDVHDRVSGNVVIEAGPRAVDVDVQVGAEDRAGIHEAVPDARDHVIQAVNHVGNRRPRHRKAPRCSGEERHEGSRQVNVGHRFFDQSRIATSTDQIGGRFSATRFHDCPSSLLP